MSNLKPLLDQLVTNTSNDLTAITDKYNVADQARDDLSKRQSDLLAKLEKLDDAGKSTGDPEYDKVAQDLANITGNYSKVDNERDTSAVEQANIITVLEQISSAANEIPANYSALSADQQASVNQKVAPMVQNVQKSNQDTLKGLFKQLQVEVQKSGGEDELKNQYSQSKHANTIQNICKDPLLNDPELTKLSQVIKTIAGNDCKNTAQPGGNTGSAFFDSLFKGWW